jgi:hypothetical protein
VDPEEDGLSVGIVDEPVIGIQEPFHVSTHEFVEGWMKASLRPMDLATAWLGVFDPGACARNQSPFPSSCQLTPRNAACKNAFPSA